MVLIFLLILILSFNDSDDNPDETVIWGKIKVVAQSDKVYQKVTLVFPIFVAETFGQVPKAASKFQNGESEKKSK